MNRTDKLHAAALEARLERSLRNQVRAPKLDGRFDAAVWARIEAENSPAIAPPTRASLASRWMLITNVVGALVTVALVIYFGLDVFASSEVAVAMPEVSPGLVEKLIASLSWPVTIASLLVGLMVTPLGRRLRAELELG